MPRLSPPRASEPISATEANSSGFPLWTPRRGVRPLLAAEPWGLLRRLVSDRAKKYGSEREALAALEQAEDFYFATGGTHFAARPLLYYYSFLNLAKAFVFSNGANPLAMWRHGLTYAQPAARSPSWTTQTLRVEVPQRNGVFRRFVRDLDAGASLRATYGIDSLIEQVVGTHQIWREAQNARDSFVHVQFELRKTPPPAEVMTVAVANDPSRRAADILRGIAARDGWRKTEATPPNSLRYELPGLPVSTGPGRGFEGRVREVAKSLKRVGIHAILTRQGYRFYVSELRRPAERLPQLAAIYGVMFYLGSITRYRPYDFDRYLSGRAGHLMREFLATQPNQFVFLLASELAGNQVVVPFGAIDMAPTR